MVWWLKVTIRFSLVVTVRVMIMASVDVRVSVKVSKLLGSD